MTSVLEYRFMSNEIGREVSVQEYFVELARAVWREDEGFSGKRPRGYSGWKDELYYALIKGDFIPGEIGNWGALVPVGGYRAADDFIEKQIFGALLSGAHTSEAQRNF